MFFTVDRVSISVGGMPLLSGISFSLSKGKVLYILGPNGAGKSSLLKAVMGIPGYEVTGGRVMLEGRT